MAVLLTNNAISTLASSLTTGATSLVLKAGTGALFPSPSGGNWFPVTVLNSAGALEIMRCTARSSDTLTVTRAQEGTTAKAFSAGDRVELRLTVAALAEFQPLAANLTALAGLAGSADKLPYFTGSGALSLAALTAAARTLLTATDQAGQQTAMGLGAAATRGVGTASGQLIENGGGASHPWMELRANGSTPFIDFSNDTASDYDVRLILTGDDVLNVDGAGVNGFQIGGYKAFNAGNVVGAVGITGGFPSGALIEFGSNANGTYMRFADGSQICSHRISTGSITLAAGGLSAAMAWTFPAAFVDSFARVFAQNNSGWVYEHVCGYEAIADTGIASLYIKNIGSTSRTMDHTIHLFAVGRWL